MSIKPEVSIVIPTYNHALYLGRALQSVLDQTYTSWEAIVIDNYSTDNTDEVMETFSDPRIKYLKIHNNQVIAVSRNEGIRASKGEWIAFLDSDDWWSTDKLQLCFERIHGEVDLVYHSMFIITDKPRYLKRKTIKSWQVKKPVIIDLIINGNALATSSVVVRSKLLKQINGMNEDKSIVAAEDYNTWLKIAQLTNNFVYIPKQLGFYRLNSQGVSSLKDMSEPTLAAVSEFICLLTSQDKSKLVSKITYTKGRFLYLAGNYQDAKYNLLKSMRQSKIGIKIKIIWMLILMTVFKNRLQKLEQIHK